MTITKLSARRVTFDTLVRHAQSPLFLLGGGVDRGGSRSGVWGEGVDSKICLQEDVLLRSRDPETLGLV
jgi:hypothetical protein